MWWVEVILQGALLGWAPARSLSGHGLVKYLPSGQLDVLPQPQGYRQEREGVPLRTLRPIVGIYPHLSICLLTPGFLNSNSQFCHVHRGLPLPPTLFFTSQPALGFVFFFLKKRV
jgi:hypothetical protein